MNRYVLTTEAQEDLRRIRAYLLIEGGSRTARYVVSAFVLAFRRLARKPGMGHQREDLTVNQTLLFWPVFSYLIVYRREPRHVAIVALLHSKRDIPAVLRQRSP
jgi:plasmid stabilization system protein ParE